MIASLLAASLLCSAQEPMLLTPTDDVWVYGFAGDPTKDAYLRAWGANGRSVAGEKDSPDDFSYSLLQWDVSRVPEGEIKEARLVLVSAPESELTTEASKAAPLEARAIASGWTEKGWTYSLATKYGPGAEDRNLFGSGSLAKSSSKQTLIEIDLLKGPGDFRAALKAAKASASQTLAIALASKVNTAEQGRSAIYKVFSKDGPADSRPVLRLVVSSG